MNLDKDSMEIKKELEEFNKIVEEYKNNIKKSIELMRRFKGKFQN